MKGFQLKYPQGATPLDLNEMDGLIPTYITTQGELNELEKENILDATVWALAKQNHDYLHVSFCLDLHKRMFFRVWRWAGKTRQSNKNIGVLKEEIYSNLKQLFDDTNHWIKYHTYNFDEIAVRFHHRLVSIHPFANGNGRHARLHTDVLMNVNKQEPLTWGDSRLYRSQEESRQKYIEALRSADVGDYNPLTQFVRT